jgi:hypothetical protein
MLVVRHMLRRRLLVAGPWITIALVAQLAVGASALSSRPVPCKQGRAKLIAADTQAVVYLGHVAARPSYTSYTAYLGCVRGSRRAYEVGGPSVGSSSGAGGARHLTLAGTVVAWEAFESAGVTGELGRESWMVVVRDLRTGSVLRRLPTGTARVKGWVGVGPTQQIVVSGNGAVAWIASVAGPAGQDALEIHVADRTGARVVAEGSDIESDSLALAGSTLYWTQGGKPSAATLN